MTGKQKCKILKEIRRQIAEANDIRYLVEECSHKGACKGTCPRCEWEVRELEKALEKRRRSGRNVALAGISAGFLLTSCSPVEKIGELFGRTVNPLEGDMLVETTAGVAVSDTEELETVQVVGEVAPVKSDAPDSEEIVETGAICSTNVEAIENGDDTDLLQMDGLMLPSDETVIDTLEGDPAFPEFDGVPAYTEEVTEVYELEGDIAFIETEAGEAPV